MWGAERVSQKVSRMRLMKRASSSASPTPSLSTPTRASRRALFSSVATTPGARVERISSIKASLQNTSAMACFTTRSAALISSLCAAERAPSAAAVRMSGTKLASPAAVVATPFAMLSNAWWTCGFVDAASATFPRAGISCCWNVSSAASSSTAALAPLMTRLSVKPRCITSHKAPITSSQSSRFLEKASTAFPHNSPVCFAASCFMVEDSHSACGAHTCAAAGETMNAANARSTAKLRSGEQNTTAAAPNKIAGSIKARRSVAPSP
mmetsp:Transcript_92743/g.259224  ORF Transcript_92743/g.259224 Transcript_92743/m.259224 type:complete len:267 (+) Transcript_92743:330-1130(+)